MHVHTNLQGGQKAGGAGSANVSYTQLTVRLFSECFQTFGLVSKLASFFLNKKEKRPFWTSLATLQSL